MQTSQIRHGVVFEEKAFLSKLKRAHQDAQDAACVAVNKAIVVGQMLIELKGHLGHGDWLAWLGEAYPDFEPRKAQRWMKLAETISLGLELPAYLQLPESTDGAKEMPLSVVLGSRAEDLPQAAVELQQLVFEFTEGKTMKEVLASAVVGGDIRGLNGRQTGGSRGEDRKDFPKFIGVKLSDVSTHLEHWEGFTPGQREKTERAFALALEKWPTALLETLREQIKEEMKKR